MQSRVTDRFNRCPLATPYSSNESTTTLLTSLYYSILQSLVTTQIEVVFFMALRPTESVSLCLSLHPSLSLCLSLRSSLSLCLSLRSSLSYLNVSCPLRALRMLACVCLCPCPCPVLCLCSWLRLIKTNKHSIQNKYT